MTREQRARILGPAGLALVDQAVQNSEPPSPEQIARLRAIFAGTGRISSPVRTTSDRAAA